MSTRNDLFAAYGDDVDGALGAWPNVDPTGYAAWSGQAERRQYRNEYRRWLSRQTITAARDTIQNRGQVRLFEPPTAAKGIQLRSTMIHQGEQMPVLGLSGDEGARVLRQICQRDLTPALTAVARAKFGLALADHIEAETERLGRPVSVAEVIGLRAVA